MKPGQFIFNGVDSESIKSFIQGRPIIQTPRRKRELKSAYGRSGFVIFDEEESYENTDMDLVLYSLGDDVNTASKNRELLFNLFDNVGYSDFIPYFDPGKIYRVMVRDYIDFDSKYYMGEGQSLNVRLTVHPWKLYVGNFKKTLTASGNIVNPYSRNSKPLFKITGNGDVTLKVNGINFLIKGINGHIWIDSEQMFAYRDVSGVITNDNSKIHTRNYPIFKPGTNTISWVGSITKLEIEPRWRTLV